MPSTCSCVQANIFRKEQLLKHSLWSRQYSVVQCSVSAIQLTNIFIYQTGTIFFLMRKQELDILQQLLSQSSASPFVAISISIYFGLTAFFHDYSNNNCDSSNNNDNNKNEYEREDHKQIRTTPSIFFITRYYCMLKIILVSFLLTF